jgi:hypothetical protein
VRPETPTTRAKSTEVEVQPEASSEGFNTGSAVLDDILEHSQQRMMEAIEHLGRRVDMLTSTGKKGPSLSLSADLTVEVA